MPDALSPWLFLLFPWFIYFLLMVLKKAVITDTSIFPMTETSSKGKAIPWGNSRLTPEQKGWIWLKETRLGATLSLHDPDWAPPSATRIGRIPQAGRLVRIEAKTLGEGGK